MTIGERIKQKREELNMSQDELAKKVGYKSRSSIQKIEVARNLPINKVEKMAAALDCTPGYLMGWEDDVIHVPSRAEGMNIYTAHQPSFEPDITAEEMNIIEAYREADELTKAMVLRTLGIEGREKRDIG